MKNQKPVSIFNNDFTGVQRGFLLSLFLILTGTLAKAQDISKASLIWTSNKSMDMADSTVYNDNCKFATNGNTTLEWNQKEGARIYTYTVTSVEGQWSDVSTDGQVKYNLALGENVTGSILFSRQQNQLKGLLTIYGNGKLRFSYTFYFDTVQAAQ